MEPRYGPINQGGIPMPPEPDAVIAARKWADAKGRLGFALEALNKASAELQAAQVAEQEAWIALEVEAGRAKVATQAVTGGWDGGGTSRIG